MNEAELLCIGNALVDVFIPVTAKQLDALGISEPVQHVAPEKIQEILLAFPGAFSSAGGGSANTAKIAAGLGVSTIFVGSVGDDPFGQFYERELTAAGTAFRLFRSALPTGICVMFQLLEGETRIAASPAAALELKREFIDDGLIRRTKVLVLDGFILHREDLTRHILERANQYGTVVALDVGSAEIAGERAAEIIRYFRAYPLILLMNEAEARSFYAGAGPHEDEGGDAKGHNREIHRMYRFFRDLTAEDLFPIIVVKQGARGSTVFAGGAVHRKATHSIIPKETTGAGDAFCAGFLAAWLRGWSLGECAGLGNRVARETLHVNGANVDRKKLHHIVKTRLEE